MNHTAAQRLLQAKHTAIAELAQQFATQIFEEVLQGDALQDQIEDVIADHEDPELFGTEDGMDYLAEVEGEYMHLLWHYILLGVSAKMSEAVTQGTMNHPSRPLRNHPQVFPTAQHLRQI